MVGEACGHGRQALDNHDLDTRLHPRFTMNHGNEQPMRRYQQPTMSFSPAKWSNICHTHGKMEKIYGPTTLELLFMEELP